MPHTMLKDQHWVRLRSVLLELNIYDKENLRQTVEGVLYHMRVGCPWRDLPPYFSKSNTVYKAYQRWFQQQTDTLFTLLIKDLGCEWVFIDGMAHDVKVAPNLIDKIGLRNEPPRLYRRLIYLSQAAMPDRVKLS